MNLNISLTFFQNKTSIALCILAVAATLYTALKPLHLAGMEFYSLLPLTYAFCVWQYNKILEYHVGGFGLKCFFIVSFVKYVLLPVYACYNGAVGAYNDLSASYYRYGIFVQILELVVSYYTISRYYKFEYDSISEKISDGKKQFYNELGICGLLLAIGMIGIVVMRGHFDAILKMTRFLVVTDRYDREADFWTYDIWAIQVFLAYMTVTTTSFFMKRNDRNENNLNIVVPLIVAFLSCSIILTNNRMTMVYYALSGLCILNAAFPKKAKTMSVIMVSLMLTVIVSFTLMKNFNAKIGSDTNRKVSEIERVSTLSSYVCGVDVVAHSCDMQEKNGGQYGIGGFFAMLYKFCMPTRLPGLYGQAFEDDPTAVELATRGSEMVSVAGETLFWSDGPALGWLVDIFVVYMIVRLLIIFEVHTKKESDLGKKYIYNWLSVLYGIFMCYCVQTLWNNTTYMPLYLGAVLMLNQKLKFNKTEIQQSED